MSGGKVPIPREIASPVRPRRQARRPLCTAPVCTWVMCRMTCFLIICLNFFRFNEFERPITSLSQCQSILFVMCPVCSRRESLGIPLMGTQFHTVYCANTLRDGGNLVAASPQCKERRRVLQPRAARESRRLLGSHPQCVTSRRCPLRVGRRPSNEA